MTRQMSRLRSGAVVVVVGLSLSDAAVRPPRVRAQVASAADRATSSLSSPGASDRFSARATWAATLADRYRVTSDITYFVAGNWEATLDVYRPAAAKAPTPTLIFFHGGGWAGMSRTTFWLHIVPYLEMGWAVVNVDYRVTPQARAPAAVEDCRCALRWVIVNAAAYNFDVDRIVVSGVSAGAHLALTTGMLPASAGFDQQCPPCMQWKCPANEEMKVAAIVNWFGITDVVDLLERPNVRAYALAWAGGGPDYARRNLAARVSPLTYVRAGLPTIVTVHGTLDPSVPYSHATRLHGALSKAGVPNRLITIEKGSHGGFTREELLRAHASIRAFLAEHGLRAVGGASATLPATLSETASFAVMLSRQYGVVPDVTYLVADNWPAQLDVYPAPPVAGRPAPTLIYFHGGGWTGGDRTTASLDLLPFFELGWTVVNVDYRPARVSLAPAAVEDGRCALRWVVRHAQRYRFDVDRLIVGGRGVGGHLALTTGMLPASAGLDRRCPGDEALKVAAIVNWGGITDMADLLEGPHMRQDAVAWFGSLPNRDQIARQVSPLHHVRAGLPPILTIHREEDPAVPASHAMRLHDALTKAGVPNTLVILPRVTPDLPSRSTSAREQSTKASRVLHAFLAEHQLLGSRESR